MREIINYLNTIFALFGLSIITFLAIVGAFELFIYTGLFLSILIIYFNSVMAYFILSSYIKNYQSNKKNDKQ